MFLLKSILTVMAKSDKLLWFTLLRAPKAPCCLISSHLYRVACRVANRVVCRVHPSSPFILVYIMASSVEIQALRGRTIRKLVVYEGDPLAS
jgi:hypothetical protein